jgi:RNA polymerase sigma factor (sigma-70 family)
VLERERTVALSQAIQGLPEQMRTCFLLRYDQGRKYKEIAVLMKISIDTVKAHLFQARKRLKLELTDPED